MEKQLVVADFDGTFSDAEKEGKPAVAGYIEDLCLLLGKNPEEVSPILQSAEIEIATNPEKNGWLCNGLIVAPAMVDPYLRTMAVARKVLDHFGAFLDISDRERLLGFLYSNNYSLSDIVFKDGAGKMLSDLCAIEMVETYVVTNSHTESVRKKIIALSNDNPGIEKMCERVIGGAKKYVVDGEAESMMISGLYRPVYLRRPAYHDILERLRVMHGIEWKDITVIGDIFELDLALPFTRGARIGLVINQFTPSYELDFIAANPGRATLIHSLSEVVPFVMNREQ